MKHQHASSANEGQSVDAPGLLDLLDEREAANALSLAVSTLRNWRSRGIGPKYIKLGARAVRYRRADLEKYVVEGIV